MASNNGGSGLLTLAGMLAGAALGAAVALVYTPHKGEENRKQMADWANARASQAQQRARDTVDRAQQKAQSQVEQAQSWATARVEQARDTAQEAVSKAQETVQNAAQSVTGSTG
jgi:gas vesicle protein